MSFVEGKNKDLVRSYSLGEIIIREGDTSKDMFVIKEGEVKVVKNIAGRDLELDTLVKGDFFGEMSLLESEPRTASIIAIKPTKVLVIQAGGLLLRLRRDPTFAFEMLQKLSNRIRTMNEKLGTILSDPKIQASEEVKEMYRG
jgi:CRP/FNR family transcriptional regulator, cyclic AMP receptor protein